MPLVYNPWDYLSVNLASNLRHIEYDHAESQVCVLTLSTGMILPSETLYQRYPLSEISRQKVSDNL